MQSIPEANCLGGELSPYLLQHATNPVHWQPWSPAVLTAACTMHRPVLLSIGYSACHWCHVMAHESFMDEATARLMNAAFVCIKVDREERPDLDHIYQGAYALMNGRGGGWPLTVFLMPDTQLPFFTGTYYPVESRFGMPAFKDVLQHISRLYRMHHAELLQQTESVASACRSLYAVPVAAPRELHLQPLHQALARSAEHFDARHGGFGGAPKFPMPAQLELLLQQGRGAPADQALHTLQQMARGGLYDHLGGGFFRYSVDAAWEIPHFEKMLYDNAALLALYSDAWLLSRTPLFATVVRDTVGWLQRELQDAAGGFHAAQDADDDNGVEGGSYVWTREAVAALLGEQEYALFAACYGLDKAANFADQWHLRLLRTPEQAATAVEFPVEQATTVLADCRARLLAQRQQRSLPQDDKVLAAWNGQMIQGLARAARIFAEPQWLAAAWQAMDFIRMQMCSAGVVMRSYRQGQLGHAGYLDDHASLLAACLELLQCHYRAVDVEFAVQLADRLLEHFQDADAGGFFLTAADHERLPFRPRSFMDDAQPAANGVAIRSLVRLGTLLGRPDYLHAADRALQAAWGTLQRGELLASAGLLAALGDYLQPLATVVIRGTAAELEHWQTTLAAEYRPQLMTVAIPNTVEGLPAALAAHTPRPEGPVAYCCAGLQCRPPCTELAALQQELAALPPIAQS